MESPVAFGSPSPAVLPGAPPAVEVAARRGDTVVGVAYLVPANPARERLGTRVVAVAGAMLLLSAALAFAHGVAIARVNAHAQRAWVEGGRPAADFRPARVAGAFDALGAVGLAGGIALLGWALVRRHAARRHRDQYRIGSEPDIDFCLDDAPTSAFSLVDRDGDRFVVRLGTGMTATLAVGNQTTEYANGGELALAAGSSARVTCGPVEFFIRPVMAARDLGTGWSAVETRPLVYGAGSALAHVGVLALAWATPPDLQTQTLGFASSDAPLLSAQIVAIDDKLHEPEPPGQGDTAGKEAGAAAEAGAEGKLGTKEPARPTGRRAMRQRDTDPAWAKNREDAIAMATEAGILGAFAVNDLHASITGTADYSSGLQAFDTLGGHLGATFGDDTGGWGTGLRDTGPGGGGKTIGVGPLNTRSGWGVCDTDATCGPGPGRKRVHYEPDVTFDPITTHGEYDGAVIRRAVRQRRAALRHCYERQLQVQPDLRGTVTASFMIDGGSGKVMSSQAAGLGSRAVESCVADVIRSIQLPRISGGGLHQVTYPFTFRSNS